MNISMLKQDLSTKRCWQGVVHSLVTKLAKSVANMERETPLIPSDQMTAKCTIENALKPEKELKEYDFAVLNLIVLEYDVKS